MSKVLPLFGESLEVEPVEVAPVESVEVEAGAPVEATAVEVAAPVELEAVAAADPVEVEAVEVAAVAAVAPVERAAGAAVEVAPVAPVVEPLEPIEAYKRARAELGERLGVTVPTDATRMFGAFGRRAAGLPRAYAAHFGGERVGPPRATRVEALEDYAAAVEASAVTDAEARAAHLYALEECPESGGFPRNAYAQVSGGWPHGRVICSKCGNAVSPTKTGLMRKHKPRHVADTNEFAARHFALLLEAHPEIKAPRR